MKETGEPQNMIITRTPFRLPLGGGGTDLPAYYKNYGGFFISGAINKYIYVFVHKFFLPGYRIVYGSTENVESAELIRHPMAREALKRFGIPGGIEVISMADVPSETGLGSSGSYAVGLLKALYAYKNVKRTPAEIAEEACDIAMNVLKEPSGKQDEYVASFGGVRAYTMDKNGRVSIEDLNLKQDVMSELENNLMLFYTGIVRKSTDVEGEKQKEIAKADGNAAERMHVIKRIGLESKTALQKGDLRRFGELLHEHWLAKRGVTKNITTDAIDHWYSVARENGAVGGKIVGAGGGGFLMLYCEGDKQRLRSAMANEGLVEHDFRFEQEGSRIVYHIASDRSEVYEEDYQAAWKNGKNAGRL